MPESTHDKALAIRALLPKYSLDTGSVGGETIIQALIKGQRFPPHLFASVTAHRVSETRICLFVQNQSQAAQLRFELGSIRNFLKSKLLPRLQQVKVIVREPVKQTKSQTVHRSAVSDQTVDTVLNAAKHIDDQPLARALQRLASHLKSPANDQR